MMTHPARTARFTIAPLLAACLLAGGLLMAGCGSSARSSGAGSGSGTGTGSTFPMKISHEGGTLTVKSPPKVLVDQYEDTYLVAAAGGNKTGRIVAITDNANQPIGPPAATVANVPQLATHNTVAKEVIVGEKPTLVITHGLSPGLAGQLTPLGINTIVPNICWDGYADAHGGRTGFDAIYSDILQYGRLLGTESYASQSVATLKSTVAHVQKEAPLPKQTVTVAGSLHGADVFVYASKSIANTELQTLGLKNSFGNVPMRGVAVSSEEIVSRNPAFLVLGYDDTGGGTPAQTLKQYEAIPGFNRIAAVRNRHLLYMSDSFLLGRAVDGLQMIYNAIHAVK